MRPTKFRYSDPVSRPNSAMPSGTTPICRFTSTMLVTRSSPRISIRPDVGASRPVSILMVVDFPAPFGPRKPKNWPGSHPQVHVLDGNQVAETPGQVFGTDGGSSHESFDSSTPQGRTKRRPGAWKRGASSATIRSCREGLPARVASHPGETGPEGLALFCCLRRPGRPALPRHQDRDLPTSRSRPIIVAYSSARFSI